MVDTFDVLSVTRVTGLMPMPPASQVSTLNEACTGASQPGHTPVHLKELT